MRLNHQRLGLFGLALAAALAAGWVAFARSAQRPVAARVVMDASGRTAAQALPAAPRAAQSPARARRPRSGPPRGLSLNQLAGLRVIYSYQGVSPPASLLAVIRAGEAAGVILFGDNVISPDQLRGVAAILQTASLASPVHAPLLVLVDQEGGAVRRLPGPPVLSEKQIGASATGLEHPREAGKSTGVNLAASGVNVNLAPVLDVYNRAGNFIDRYQRSYSSNPIRAAELGAAFIAGQQATGVAATAKHFPGLGTAAQAQNTDLTSVVLNQSLAHLRLVDEAPFRAALTAGVKLVMLSWAIYPALDRHLPAGLSQTVIKAELRGRLGFRGVTMTDGIFAGAVTPFGSLAARSVRAAAAGDDLILAASTNPYANTPAIGLSVLRALASAMATHRLDRSASLDSVHRILDLRKHP